MHFDLYPTLVILKRLYVWSTEEMTIIWRLFSTLFSCLSVRNISSVMKNE